MKAKTFETQYELTDFNLYMDDNNDREEIITIVDFVVEGDDVNFIKEDFGNTFVIDTDKVSYLFSDYEVSECYSISNNLIRVVCIK